ncbi:MAG: aminomethyltransferase family protein [Thermoleophilia bacterium]
MTQARNYADSHRVVKISAKRFHASPYVGRYATPETVFGVYSGRLYPLSLGQDPVADYWHLRRQAVLYDVPERPIQIEGPDAERLLDLVLTRDVTKLAPGKARYALACNDRGGILMDGVLIRWTPDRFWFVLADGEFVGWLEAHARGLEVVISDPQSWVMQVQGPTSLDVLAVACEEPPSPFPYFGVAAVRMGGQDVLVSRTGWSGELGFEIYTLPGTDGAALWDHVLAAGETHGLAVQSLESLGIRRIEAGILDNGTDMDSAMTPFAAGLGAFVDLEKVAFVGREALGAADRRPLLFGISGASIPSTGATLYCDGSAAGRVTTGAWSPFLGCGIGYVRMNEPGALAGTELSAADDTSFQIVELPFHDREKAIPRGLTT